MKEKTNFFNLYFYIVTGSFMGTYIGFYKNLYNEYYKYGLSIKLLSTIFSNNFLDNSTIYSFYGATIGTIGFILFGEKLK